MKKLLLVLSLLLALTCLVACSQKSTDNVEDFVKQVEEKGYTPIVVPVYEPKEKDGKVFIIEECYDDPSAGGYVTVAVNDYALKDCYINNITGIPARLSAKEYDKCIAYYDGHGDYDSSLEISTCYKDTDGDGYYEYVKVSSNDLENLILNAGVDKKSSFKTALGAGLIPTLSTDLVPHVITLADCTIDEMSETLTANVSDYNVAIVPAEIDSMYIKEVSSYKEKDRERIPHENKPLFYLGVDAENITVGNHKYLVAMDAPNATDLQLANTSFYYCKVDKNGFAIFDDFVLIDYVGNDKDIVIPEGITHIMGRQKSHRIFTDIQSVTLPESLVTISCEAFASCPELYEVKLPGSVNYLDSYSFNYRTVLILPKDTDTYTASELCLSYSYIIDGNQPKEKIEFKVPDTKDKDKLVSYIESMGRKPVFVKVYEPDEKDGAAFIIERSFNDYFSGDYVTVAINDHSLFDKYLNTTVPAVLTYEDYDTIYNKLVALDKSSRVLNKFYNYYVLLDPNDPTLSKAEKEEMLNKFPSLKQFKDGLYLFDTEATERERTEMAEIIAETGYSPRSLKEKISKNKDLLEIYLVSGDIPTLKSNLVPYVMGSDEEKNEEETVDWENYVYPAINSSPTSVIVVNKRYANLGYLDKVFSLTLEEGCEATNVSGLPLLTTLDAPEDIKEKFAEEFSGIYLTLD